MASNLNFDELNVLGEEKTTHIKAIPYDEYFDVMNITFAQKEDRVELARILEDVFIYAFALAESMKSDTNNITKLERLDSAIEEHLRDTLQDYGINFEKDAYWGNYANTRALQIAQATINRSNDSYYTSVDRAMRIAENEANVILNHYDLNEAIEQGCTSKTWVTMRDERVRFTHIEVDNKTIPIRDYFVVGNSLMMHPCDVNGIDVESDEIVNCRCSVIYR